MTNLIRWFMAKWLQWVFEADREPEAYGDVIHVPEKAKRRAA